MAFSSASKHQGKFASTQRLPAGEILPRPISRDWLAGMPTPACEPVALTGVTASPPAVVQPTLRAERITSVDVVRGFALLGILLMNIVGFGLYRSAYNNPTAAGGATDVNLWTWIVLHVLAEGKMRCL